jgi:hypothetical protein
MIEELKPELPALEHMFVVGEHVPKGMIQMVQYLLF